MTETPNLKLPLDFYGKVPTEEAIKEAFGKIDGAVRLPRRHQIVATRGQCPFGTYGNNTPSGRSDTRAEDRTEVFTGPYACSSIVTGHSNYVVPGNGAPDADVPNDVTLRSALELTSPVFSHVNRYGGRDSGVMAPGAPLVLSDPLNIRLSGSTKYYVRSDLSVADNTKVFPRHSSGGGAGDAGNGYISTSATPQVAATGALAAPAGNAAAGALVMPTVMLGIPVQPQPGVILVVDSLGIGVADTPDADGNTSFLGRGLTSGVTWNGIPNVKMPYAKFGAGGDTIQQNLDTLIRKRAAWQYGTHIVFQISSNDLAANADLATMIARALVMLNAAKAVIGPYGRPLNTTWVIPFPRTNAANVPAAAFAAGGVADQFIAWLKAQVGQGLLDQVIDARPALQDPAQPDRWLPSILPADGVHGGHEQARPYVSAWASGLKV